uniref:Uncharacterized protein n=1 Tax=Globodera rostochiensis TaxID=31243 RepID=A0A914H1K4_GLORO
MEEFWISILVFFFATNSLEKAESVQLFDEIFGEGWWDNEKADEWDKLTLEQNFHHQIDGQNTQLGQSEPNSTDQLGQIESNSTDQNPPLTEILLSQSLITLDNSQSLITLDNSQSLITLIMPKMVKNITK